jgi:hypothetical protein
MNAFLQFMASNTGRILRIVVGLILVVLGLFFVGGVVGGAILVVVGLVPLLAGIFDVCVFSPLFGGPFKGPEIRARK